MIDKSAQRNFFYAIAILVGMIVGAGIFGLPYVAAQAGLAASFFYLALLGGAVLLVHLFYGEITLRTNQNHRLIGYTAKYLGGRAKKFAAGAVLFEHYGSLLAYIILGGNFLNIIFSRFLAVSEFFWAIIFFLVGAALIYCGVRRVARNELFLTGLLLVSLAILLFGAAPRIDFDNWRIGSFNNFFLPYGVILFSLAGSTAIPEVRRIMAGQERDMKKVIICGTLIPVVLYIFFILVVVGVTGAGTTEEAINGLLPYAGNWVVFLGATCGVLAVFTSFLVMGLALKETFQDDYSFKKNIAFALALAVPLLAYLAGLKSFIFVIGLIGALAAGLDGILMILIYFQARKNGDRQPEYRIKAGGWWGGALILLFGLGIIYHLFYWLVN